MTSLNRAGRRRARPLAQAAVVALAVFSNAAAAVAQEAPSVDAMRALPGFVNLFWDEGAGRLWLEPGPMDREMLYVTSMARGVGSNDLGLDRGQLGSTRVVSFQRIGARVFLVEKNLRFRAETDNPAERDAIAASFADSTLWGFEAVDAADGRTLVDATGFLLRDTHWLGARLAQAGEGNFAVDPSRSAVWMERTRSFPRNTELEAMVTFVGHATGPWLPTVLADSDVFTVHMHHSFVALPEPGFEALPMDPRAGYLSGSFGPSHYDYATAVSEPLKVALTARHRLKRKNPELARSEAVEPIVYYLDPGVPEPVRGALLDGARWWNEAFEAAGYIDAFRVELLPPGADPMDVRYNVIQWVHRSTRGWSYGASVVDPRTGEIIKGHVTLGSLRVRQDYLIAEGLLTPYDAPEQTYSPEALEMALARIRQLSAHEVGHTLGLNHNFAASTTGRASVMDYPHPLESLADDGSIDLGDAYGEGLGEWDVRAIVYGYSDFPPGVDPAAARAEILKATLDGKLIYITDADARVPGAAHALAHLWDNGTDAAEELERLTELRRAALDRFSEKAIPYGEPQATLEEVLVPLYLMHRFQVQAAARLVGGQMFRYTLRGDGQPAPRVVEAAQQRRALDALLATLSVEFLSLPDAVVAAIAPRPPGHPLTRESFPRHTGVIFDPIGAAMASADLTLAELFNRERAARLDRFHAASADLPGFGELVGAVLDQTWFAKRQKGAAGLLHRAVNERVLEALLALANDAAAESAVRGVALGALKRIADTDPRSAPDLDEPYALQAQLAAARLEQLLAAPGLAPAAPLAV
ncbi:MAG: zinc-dependent metalloprotease, partial [Pseudomonadota bacterium]